MSVQYDQYLEKHKANIRKAFEWIRNNLPEILDNKVDDYEWQICFNHDDSKTRQDEYVAYDAYFYGGNRSYSVVNKFYKAFNTHIHRNPHHWQHWVLMRDDPGQSEIVFDMPINYVVEMICDWWSFSWDKGDLHEIFTWYDEHKNYIKLSKLTRHNVEEILNAIKEKITK